MTSFEPTLKDWLRYRWPHRAFLRNQGTKAIRRWHESGRTDPPPPALKAHRILQTAEAYRAKTFVETGTSLGQTLAVCLDSFERLFSIELSAQLYARAKWLFRPFPKVSLICGDSGQELKKILEEVEQPVVFWLDAHWSGPGTARGTNDTPVLEELEVISASAVKDFVILIDDARCFDGSNGYPTLSDCEARIGRLFPRHGFRAEHDVIAVEPRPQ